jgi:type I restriction enzyme S subunit
MKLERLELGTLIDRGAIIEVQDGNHGERHPKATDYVDDGIPFVMANDFSGNWVNITRAQKIPLAVADKLRIGFAKTDDVLLTHKGTIGSTAIVSEVDPYWMLTPQVTYYRTDPKQLNNWYLMYAFREPIFQKTMRSRADQATRPYIGITAQRKLHVLFRPIEEQLLIVDTLRPYDEAITNNRRRIELLEQSARLLFKDWFVYLRYPGHQHDKIVAGVPEGWCRKSLGDIAICNASTHSVRSMPSEINYIDISSVERGSIVQKTTMLSQDAPGRARRRATDGDVVWSNVRPNLRQYALVLEPEEEDVFSTGFTVLSAKTVPFSFLYIAVTTDAFVSHLVNHTTGASYPAVRPDDFERAVLLIPKASLLDEYHTQCEPMLRLAHQLDLHNKKLIEARDLLLPRLMDGRLSV